MQIKCDKTRVNERTHPPPREATLKDIEFPLIGTILNLRPPEVQTLLFLIFLFFL